jgi:hypothetical protein
MSRRRVGPAQAMTFLKTTSVWATDASSAGLKEAEVTVKL